MKTSNYSWLWFSPLMIPALGIMGFEYEQASPLGFRNPESSKFVRSVHTTTVTVAWLAAFLGFYLMISAQPAWYWFTPLITPAIILFPGKLKEWESQEEQKELQKELLEVNPSPSILRRIIKLVLWLGLLAFIWYIGSYYLLVWLLG